mmetsp:Transcript_37214/g.63308  ORF Transcript_37214/g.63308 Transcript_37214/m.63308 type:complete len:118 (-) Transcript_37214:1519-1872(-)
MTFTRFHLVFIGIGWATLLGMTCEAFVPSAPTKRITELNLKRTVSDRVSFGKRSNKTENAEHRNEEDDEAYHRRIVHFELNSDKIHKKDGPMAADVTSDRTRTFGWDHRDFARTADP